MEVVAAVGQYDHHPYTDEGLRVFRDQSPVPAELAPLLRILNKGEDVSVGGLDRLNDGGQHEGLVGLSQLNVDRIDAVAVLADLGALHSALRGDGPLKSGEVPTNVLFQREILPREPLFRLLDHLFLGISDAS